MVQMIIVISGIAILSLTGYVIGVRRVQRKNWTDDTIRDGWAGPLK